MEKPRQILPRPLVSIMERQQIEAAIEQAEDSEDEETTEAQDQRLDALEAEEERLKERLQVPDLAPVALAGALVTIDRKGKLRIERGLFANRHDLMVPHAIPRSTAFYPTSAPVAFVGHVTHQLAIAGPVWRQRFLTWLGGCNESNPRPFWPAQWRTR